MTPQQPPARQIEQWPFSRISFDDRNARTHSDEQIAAIARSLQEFGWTMPMLVDEGGRLIAGEGRLRGAQTLGQTEGPVIVARGWSDAQRRAYALADNRLPLDAGWDMDRLGAELAALSADGFDLDVLGFSEVELGDLLEP